MNYVQINISLYWGKNSCYIKQWHPSVCVRACVCVCLTVCTPLFELTWCLSSSLAPLACWTLLPTFRSWVTTADSSLRANTVLSCSHLLHNILLRVVHYIQIHPLWSSPFSFPCQLHLFCPHRNISPGRTISALTV